MAINKMHAFALLKKRLNLSDNDAQILFPFVWLAISVERDTSRFEDSHPIQLETDDTREAVEALAKRWDEDPELQKIMPSRPGPMNWTKVLLSMDSLNVGDFRKLSKLI